LTSDTIISAPGILAGLESFPARNDDFHVDFISETLILQLHTDQPVYSDELLKTLQFKTSLFSLKLAWAPRNIYFVDYATAAEDPLPNGPYFLHWVHVHEA
jgi:hypothetical protein